MVKRWTDRMAGVKYAPKPYEKPVTVVLYHASKERCSGNQARNQCKETQSYLNAGAVTG